MLTIQDITEDHLDLMHNIQEDSQISQREISKNTGISLGKVNYILKALIDIGFVKVDNFSKSTQKINYVYIFNNSPRFK